VSFRSERHVVTLNIYAIDGARAKLLDAPDLFRDVTGRTVDSPNDIDVRSSVPDFTWTAPRRFHLTDYRVLVASDAKLLDKLGPLARKLKYDGDGSMIEFSAEADGELLPDGKIRMDQPKPAKFVESQ
jgi:hypothetical protein